MSDKILNLLNSGKFRREKASFKAAVLETALRGGLIAYDTERDFFLNAKNGTILLGLLPDADGRWTVMEQEGGCDE